MLGDRVRFLGWVQDLPALYGAIDVVALTSRSEGTPVALIEAAASGTPAVATGVGGVPEVVRDRRTGLLVPPGDPVSVAAQLLTLLAGPRGRPQDGGGRRALGRDRFSQERLADDLTSLYGELLARARANGSDGSASSSLRRARSGPRRRSAPRARRSTARRRPRP